MSTLADELREMIAETCGRWKAFHAESLIGPLHGAGVSDGYKWAAEELERTVEALLKRHEDLKGGDAPCQPNAAFAEDTTHIRHARDLNSAPSTSSPETAPQWRMLEEGEVVRFNAGHEWNIVAYAVTGWYPVSFLANFALSAGHVGHYRRRVEPAKEQQEKS
jgi:hypothetical protein